jgi:UDP-N-acetylmuramate-alanine ligase
MEGDELAVAIGRTQKNVSYIDDDTTLVTHLVQTAKKDDCIVFLGSHGFRGMIEETINKLSMIK